MQESKPSVSYPKLRATSNGDVIGASGRIIYGEINCKGYRVITVYVDGHRNRKRIGAHVVVCEAFHGARPEGKQVGHRDGDSLNNHPDNLRWVTQIENELDKLTHGRRPRGSTHGCAILTEEIVKSIRSSTGMSRKQLAVKYGTSLSNIHMIIGRKTWRHI